MRKVRGVGINDANYSVTKEEMVGGKRKTVWRCPFYLKWLGMVSRCYMPDDKRRREELHYIDVTVCDSWLFFSNFKNWMIEQDWEGKEIDKDFLSEGCKIYSPETCVFISKRVNNFCKYGDIKDNGLPTGVTWKDYCGKYRATIRNLYTGKLDHLGYSDCPEELGVIWKNTKNAFAVDLVNTGTVKDPRIINILLERFRV